MANIELRSEGVGPISLLERAKQELTMTARGDRIARTIGWTAIALGAWHLLMPRAVARWLTPGGLVGLLGAVELAGGAALLRARRSAGARTVQRSITIDAPAELLYARWRDPAVMTQIMQPLGTVTADPSGEGALRWQVAGPLGRTIEWVTRIVEDQPGTLVRWATVDGASIASEGSVEFRQDRAELGTIVTLRLRLGTSIPHLVPELLIAKVLRRFKSLAETAEIPTLEHNPSARASAFAH
jgi:uncharacterized membrane protein